jgi:hypothetical protein
MWWQGVKKVRKPLRKKNETVTFYIVLYIAGE